MTSGRPARPCGWPRPCVPVENRQSRRSASRRAGRTPSDRRDKDAKRWLYWEVGPMQDQGLLTALESLAEQLKIPVSYAAMATEELPGRGGLCVLHGERRIIIERT